jgi:putative ABC transport system permease protein
VRRALVTLELAGRNLVRQRRRTGLIGAAMALGVAVLIFFLGLGDGMHAQWIDAGVRLGDGHVTIETAAFQAGGDLADRLAPDLLAPIRRALRAPGVAGEVVAASPRLRVSALAASATGAVPVHAMGVDPALEARFSLFPSRLVSGRFLREDDRLSAVIGRGLADRLRLAVGSRLVLTAQGADGVQEQLVRVTGIFRTGIRDVDEGIVELPLESAGAWLGVPGSATAYSILLRDAGRATGVAAELSAALPRPAAAYTWRETSPELDAAVRIDNVGNYLFNAVLLALVALAVLEALLVSVLHRGREFGLLQAMGVTAAGTGALVLAEGVLLALVSGVTGLGLGLGITALLGHTGIDLSAMLGNQLSVSGAIVSPVVHPTVRLARAGQSLAVVFVLGMLSSLYPMWQASRLDAATAMQVDP